MKIFLILILLSVNAYAEEVGEANILSFAPAERTPIGTNIYATEFHLYGKRLRPYTKGYFQRFKMIPSNDSYIIKLMDTERKDILYCNKVIQEEPIRFVCSCEVKETNYE